MLGGDVADPVQEVATGQRVQAGHRLVQDQQLGALRDGQGERELGPLSPGQPPGTLVGVEAELGDAALGETAIPVRVEPAAEPQVVADRQAGVRRRVLGDEPDPGELRRALRGPRAEHLDAARVRGDQPDGEAHQGRLAGPVRSDQPHHAPGRDREGAVSQRPPPPVPLAEAPGCQNRVVRHGPEFYAARGHNPVTEPVTRR